MNMSMWVSAVLVAVILMLFFAAGKKEKWDSMASSTFECGFTSYYMSRFSFSIHYIVVALIFLFFDLELCFLMPYLNEQSTNINLIKYLSLFVTMLFIGLLIEWKKKKMEWTN